MNPTQLSHQLRRHSGDFLEERRGVIASSLTAIGCGGGAWQLGQNLTPGLEGGFRPMGEKKQTGLETIDAGCGRGRRFIPGRTLRQTPPSSVRCR